MKNKILDEACSLGITKLGFTNITKLDYLKNYLNYRIEKDYNCEFEEKNLNKRIDATCLLENCSTIITAIFPYAIGYKLINREGMGNLSISSFGIDYHTLVHNKLEELAIKLQKHQKFNFKICVDNTPLIDRAVCENSGLGYIGNNSMLINDEYGSFVFLGYILTDLHISAAEKKNKNSCGNCNICINKCPNGAILPNGIINTKRCISYLTQTRQYIPIEFRKAMGTQIYGCDVCQVNCPKNYKVINQSSDYNYDSLLVDLNELLAITNSEFKLKYGKIAGSWRGKNIWKRNAIIACANMKLYRFYDLIINELESQSDMFKTYAAWALLEIDKNKSKDIIYNKLKYESGYILDEYKKLLEV